MHVHFLIPMVQLVSWSCNVRLMETKCFEWLTAPIESWAPDSFPLGNSVSCQETDVIMRYIRAEQMERCGLTTCVCLHVTFIWRASPSNAQFEPHYHDRFIPSLWQRMFVFCSRLSSLRMEFRETNFQYDDSGDLAEVSFVFHLWHFNFILSNPLVI